MRHGGLISLIILISACRPGPGDALRVTLETAEQRAETCYLIEVFDEAGTERLASTRLARDETKRNYLIGVARLGFPATVSLRAQALIGADCESATKPNGVSELMPATFDPNRIVAVTVSLTGGDADQDGFVAESRGGGDCNDSDAAISPGARELCSGAIDHDCNGQPPCMDDACVGMPCAGTPTRLALLDAPASIRVNQCAGPIGIELEDSSGQQTSPTAGGTLTLGGPIPFFTDAQCSGAPVTQLTLLPIQNVWLRASTPRSATISVSSVGLAGDSKSVEVLGDGPSALVFEGPSMRAAAGACSPELVVALVDDAGARAEPQQPVVVSLSSDAGTPFAFFSDLACMQQISELSIFDGGASTLHFSGQKAGAFTLRAEANGFSAAEQPALIDPGVTNSLSITTPAQPVATNSCAGPFLVEGRDLYGNPTQITAPTVTIPDAGATVFTSPTCGMVGQPTSAFGITFPLEGEFTLTASSGALMASQPIVARDRGPPGSRYRWPLVLTTGARAPTNGYAKYTLTLSLDSRGIVDAGFVDPTFSDLRVYFASDAGWQEVDRLVENPNTNATTVRFPSQTDLPNSATDNRYALFSGPFDGGAALARPGSVYLFFDDFESGSLSKWTIRNGAWAAATDRAHGGTGSMKFPAEAGNSDKVIEANPALVEADVLFEAWWNTSQPSATNFAQLVRLQPSVLSNYELTCENAAGWTIARATNAAWTEMGNNSGTVDTDTWMRLSIAMSDRDLFISKNGVQLGGTVQAPLPMHGAANIGFRKYTIGGAIWIDDVTVRRYTFPEPTISLGVPFAVPSP